MRYIFGDYSLDTQRYELRRTGPLISLGPQVFNVLAYLVAHRDRVVSRDELFARLWPDQFVTDDALGRCIRAARRALEDRSEAPRYITTNRGRGYRFIAPVQEHPHGLPEDGVSTTVSAQRISRLPSMVDSEEAPPPVAISTVSGEIHRLSEEFCPASLAGEYKQVTVLCGGLADALALAIRLGPEAMHRRMQTVFTVVQQVLQRYAGSLIEFNGEGFVALFGAPVAQEDHAQRAVLAALALHAQVGASTSDGSQAPVESLALCLGLHTGRVVVDHLGGDPQRRALAHARDHQEQGHQAQALWLLGEIARYDDPPEIASAAVHYQQALVLAEKLGMRPLRAHCHRGLGTLYATTVQREQAHAELSTAIALYRTMEMAFWLPQAEAALAQVEA